MAASDVSSSDDVSALLAELRAQRDPLPEPGEPPVATRTPLPWEPGQRRAQHTSARAFAADHIGAIAEAALEFCGEETTEGLCAAIAARARSVVPGCREAGVTLARGRREFELAAVTGPVAAAGGRLQIELGEGPALTVIAEARPVRVVDASVDGRWPAFARRAAEVGACSMLALPLSARRGPIGSLMLYAAEPGGVTAESELVGAAFAVHAGAAIGHVEMEKNLRIGLQTREEIGRAVGILMERYRVTAKDAFDMLVVVSQHSHRKLRDVAAWMNETGQDPTALLHPEPDGGEVEH